MNFARVRMYVALALFLGWIGYLGYAVWWNTFHKPDLVSRAQLTEATVLVVADLTADEEGKPKELAKVTTRLSQVGPDADVLIVVENLPSAQPPGKAFPGSGSYLLPLVPGAAEKVYRIADLPQSPGYPRTKFVRPVIYPWTPDVQAQVRKLGLLP